MGFFDDAQNYLRKKAVETFFPTPQENSDKLTKGEEIPNALMDAAKLVRQKLFEAGHKAITGQEYTPEEMAALQQEFAQNDLMAQNMMPTAGSTRYRDELMKKGVTPPAATSLDRGLKSTISFSDNPDSKLKSLTAARKLGLDNYKNVKYMEKAAAESPNNPYWKTRLGEEYTKHYSIKRDISKLKNYLKNGNLPSGVGDVFENRQIELPPNVAEDSSITPYARRKYSPSNFENRQELNYSDPRNDIPGYAVKEDMKRTLKYALDNPEQAQQISKESIDNKNKLLADIKAQRDSIDKRLSELRDTRKDLKDPRAISSAEDERDRLVKKRLALNGAEFTVGWGWEHKAFNTPEGSKVLPFYGSPELNSETGALIPPSETIKNIKAKQNEYAQYLKRQQEASDRVRALVRGEPLPEDLVKPPVDTPPTLTPKKLFKNLEKIKKTPPTTPEGTERDFFDIFSNKPPAPMSSPEVARGLDELFKAPPTAPEGFSDTFKTTPSKPLTDLEKYQQNSLDAASQAENTAKRVEQVNEYHDQLLRATDRQGNLLFKPEVVEAMRQKALQRYWR